ncbi:hypothetical protein GCM10020256_31430 [Streptomyces thermocoprophilus]
MADLGCGPGRITAYLASLGLSVYGLDLSESMLAIARREHPGLRFEQGSMTRLDLADGDLAGAVCWYSTIHTPDEELPALFAELYRVLAPPAPRSSSASSRARNPCASTGRGATRWPWISAAAPRSA